MDEFTSHTKPSQQLPFVCQQLEKDAVSDASCTGSNDIPEDLLGFLIIRSSPIARQAVSEFG